jgi:CheY-like chemotaxis protein
MPVTTGSRRPAFKLSAGDHGVNRTEPYQLLIADDDAGFREVLRAIFEPLFALLEAGSGEEAVEIVEGEHVDLILIDMNMHKLTGLDTVRIVKQIDSRLPCILCTSDATDEIRAQAREVDVWSVLAKPVRKRELLTNVSSAIDSTYGGPDVSSAAGSMN